jgi:hypothetical protein
MSDNDIFQIKSPWELVDITCVDDFIYFIKEFLPPDHELQNHVLFPWIKWGGRPIFIIDDDTTGEYLLMDFEKIKKCKGSRCKVPTIVMLKNTEEVAARIESDHYAETEKYKQD